MSGIPWFRIWECAMVDHTGHTGCAAFMWLSDLYDNATGVIGLAAVLGMTIWINIDDYRRRSTMTAQELKAEDEDSRREMRMW